MNEQHPVRLLVEDDLHRSRLTVFFRLILAIPHFIWAILWSIAVVFAAIANWVVTLAAGRPPAGLHGFLCRYIRYITHLNAYFWLVANPYPPFAGDEDAYPVDVRLPGPAPQVRWKTLLRIILAIPALLASATLGGIGNVRVPVFGAGKSGNFGASFSGGLATACAVLGWFASVVRGTMPRGLRDAGAYSTGYAAQLLAYLLLVTDRYPNADPVPILETIEPPPPHPVHLVGDAHDLRRSRVMVIFRLPLAIPHFVWLYLWSIAAVVAIFLNWFVTLVAGRPARPFHRFVSRFVRYQLHVYAFVFLAANPFPGFVGAPGSYPLDLDLPGVERQNRWKTGFRILLAFPAAIVSSVLGWSLLICAVLTWFAALVTGSAPWGLRNLSAYALRYAAQLNAYAFLLTDRYPHASPLEGAEPEPLYEAPAPYVDVA
jgi:Domain of unknown function (DUF4389)